MSELPHKRVEDAIGKWLPFIVVITVVIGFSNPDGPCGRISVLSTIIALVSLGFWRLRIRCKYQTEQKREVFRLEGSFKAIWWACIIGGPFMIMVYYGRDVWCVVFSVLTTVVGIIGLLYDVLIGRHKKPQEQIVPPPKTQKEIDRQAEDDFSTKIFLCFGMSAMALYMVFYGQILFTFTLDEYYQAKNYIEATGEVLNTYEKLKLFIGAIREL